MKVLLVEDDVDLLDLLTYALRREGYSVVVATDGQQGLRRWEAEKPDIVLLDANLPKLDGFEVCRRIRHESTTPIIMLTARKDEADIVRGLQLGADDYVIKPFSAKQLLARMQAVLRRSQSGPQRRPASELRVGDLVLNMQSYEAIKGGKPVQLTPREFRILYMLAMNAGRIVPYSLLVSQVWGYDAGGSISLKTHISHIRKKLKLSPAGKGSINAVTGIGYSLAQS